MAGKMNKVSGNSSVGFARTNMPGACCSRKRTPSRDGGPGETKRNCRMRPRMAGKMNKVSGNSSVGRA